MANAKIGSHASPLVRIQERWIDVTHATQGCTIEMPLCGEGVAPRLQKFVADIALRTDEKWKAETSLFARLSIPMHHALLTTVLLRHRRLHYLGMIKFSDASYAKEMHDLSPVPES
jgi:hypothetical protein